MHPRLNVKLNLSKNSEYFIHCVWSEFSNLLVLQRHQFIHYSIGRHACQWAFLFVREEILVKIDSCALPQTFLLYYVRHSFLNSITKPNLLEPLN